MTPRPILRTGGRGSGTKSSPDDTVPMPAGSFVTNVGRYITDGAKDVETILQIVGEEPATSTRAQAQ